jgi:hypothetical protein
MLHRLQGQRPTRRARVLQNPGGSLPHNRDEPEQCATVLIARFIEEGTVDRVAAGSETFS